MRIYFADFDRAQIDAAINWTLESAAACIDPVFYYPFDDVRLSALFSGWRRSSVIPIAGRTRRISFYPNWVFSPKSRRRGFRLQSLDDRARRLVAASLDTNAGWSENVTLLIGWVTISPLERQRFKKGGGLRRSARFFRESKPSVGGHMVVRVVRTSPFRTSGC